ncbi:hypothetical protein IAQ61_003933 [Plenodomus lingam]|uniref:uncharacterized protein n=1 Tax=Leptosphaeria maculans TaxID=5022 RepID=UPI00332BA02F|nr:hypothetical protein IAQ61_003933 [Plenodomus lingam]
MVVAFITLSPTSIHQLPQRPTPPDQLTYRNQVSHFNRISHGAYHSLHDVFSAIKNNIPDNAKLENSCFTRMIIDDPILLRMFEPEAIPGCHDLDGNPWPPMQLTHIPHGQARQSIYESLHEISDILRQEAKTPNFNEDENKSAFEPRAHFDLGRLVDLSRLPNGASSADEYPQANANAREAVLNSIREMFFSGLMPALRQRSLAHPFNQPFQVELTPAGAASTFPSMTHRPQSTAGPPTAHQNAKAPAQQEDNNQVSHNEATVESEQRHEGKALPPSKIDTRQSSTVGRHADSSTQSNIDVLPYPGNSAAPTVNRAKDTTMRNNIGPIRGHTQGRGQRS